MNRKRRAEEDDLTVTSLPAKKLGRPLLLGEELERKIQLYLKAIRESGGVVNTAIALGAARGIILKLNRTMLLENGGHVDLTKAWARGLLGRMGYVKRRGTTSKSKNLVENFDDLKVSFLEQVSTMVVMDEIPPEMILNWDQTGLNLIPSSSWAMEQRGAQRVEITGLNDKRMITAVFCGTLTGDFLPIQLVYQGKTDRCHPKYNFPEDWHITHSLNRWSTEETMKDYLDHVVFPYINGVRASCDLSHNYPALAIFDNFKGQVTDDILQLLEDHNVHSVRLLANCTNRLQPMDISLNKATKDFIRQKFNDWYSEKVAEQIGDGANFDQQLVQPVDLSAAVLKTVGAKWLVQMHEYIQDNPQLIVNGFTQGRDSRSYRLCQRNGDREAVETLVKLTSTSHLTTSYYYLYMSLSTYIVSMFYPIHVLSHPMFIEKEQCYNLAKATEYFLISSVYGAPWVFLSELIHMVFPSLLVVSPENAAFYLPHGTE